MRTASRPVDYQFQSSSSSLAAFLLFLLAKWVAAEVGVDTNASPNRSPSATAALISGPNPSSSSSSSNSDFRVVEVGVGMIDFNIGLLGRTGWGAGPAKVSMNDLETSEMIKEARLEDFESLKHTISDNGGI